MKKGDTVYLLTQGNAARRGGQRTIEAKVTSAGSKYITTDYFGTSFYADSLRQRTQYSDDYLLFKSIEDLENYKETKRVTDALRSFFNGYGKLGLSLDQMQRIEQIINENAKYPQQ